MLTNQDLYRCYSINLMQHLSDNGVRYVLIAKDIKSKILEEYKKADQSKPFFSF